MAPTDSIETHTHALSTLEESDMLLASTPNLPISGVCAMDQVTPEWLSSVLGTHVPGAAITSTSVAGGHEGMTSRHKWRLTWNEAGKAASLPEAIFFKATPENAHLRETLSLIHMAELESHVYNELQPDLADLIPKCYYAQAYPGGRFMIILEDIEARGIKGHWMGDTCSIAYARAVAVAQAQIHSRFWNSPRFASELVWIRPRTRRFGELWMRRFFNGNRATFLASELGQALPQYVRDLVTTYDRHAVKLHTYWDSKPPTLVHGDSHLGNVLEFPDGRAGYYDWQCLFRGYGYRDLSYFLMSALTVEDCDAHEREIFDLYTDTLVSLGVDIPDRDEAWRDYCLLALERFDAAMTSLTNGGYGHARHAFERQVRTISHAVQEHDVAALLDKVLTTGSV